MSVTVLFLYMWYCHILGPEFNRDCWFNEKFNLGLDFPNVSDKYIYILWEHIVLLISADTDT